MSLAYRCEICEDEPEWVLERRGDAVITWACGTDLNEVMRNLQRHWERTQVTVSRAGQVAARSLISG